MGDTTHSEPSRAEASRLVVVGKNSSVWQAITDHDLAPAVPTLVLSHSHLSQADFSKNDVVWIFSYAPDEAGNEHLLNGIANKSMARAYYVSTATAVVADETRCYRYPRVKRAAENHAQDVLKACVCRLGVVFADKEQLPAGPCAATSVASIAEAMTASCAATCKPQNLVLLYDVLETTFQSQFEGMVYKSYSGLMTLARPWPCVLRPIDLVLRALGYRWYGYVFLGNFLCKQMTLSSAPD